MRPLLLASVACALLALAGCALLDTGEDPAVCTEEFRMYFVHVVDGADRPVEGLATTSRLVRTGEVLTTGQDTPSDFGYLVASDAHRDRIREGGDEVLFTAEGQGLEAEATFTFADDGCHVVKRSGPTRIIAEPAGD